MPAPSNQPFEPRQNDKNQTHDDPDELFDLVDLADRVIGQVRRGEAHRNPALIHRSVQVLVFTSDRRLLLQYRSATKDLFPNYFCASGSGHVASGEDYIAAAGRELSEELGVSAQLTSLGKALIRSEPETEMTMIFVAKSDGPFHFHPTETAGGWLFQIDEALDGMASGALPMTPALRVAITELVGKVGQSKGSLADFLDHLG